MNGNPDIATLAMDHLHFAGLLAGLFAAVTIAYLAAFFGAARDLPRRSAFLLHTLYLLWQSNVAFMAVVALYNGSRLLAQAGALMDGWQYAPYRVPAAVMLYAGILLLSVIYAGQRGSAAVRDGT